MASINYINYKDLNEFYTIKETCALFNMDKDTLKEKSIQYNVHPRQNEIGEFGFVKYDIRKLHNAIYHEHNNDVGKNDDPWA